MGEAFGFYINTYHPHKMPGIARGAYSGLYYKIKIYFIIDIALAKVIVHKVLGFAYFKVMCSNQAQILFFGKI